MKDDCCEFFSRIIVTDTYTPIDSCASLRGCCFIVGWPPPPRVRSVRLRRWVYFFISFTVRWVVVVTITSSVSQRGSVSPKEGQVFKPPSAFLRTTEKLSNRRRTTAKLTTNFCYFPPETTLQIENTLYIWGCHRHHLAENRRTIRYHNPKMTKVDHLSRNTVQI